MKLARLAATATLTLALLAAPLAAEAQQPGKVYRIGYLSHGAFLSGLVDRSESCIKGLVGGFRELGYREGHNLLIEPRSAEGRQERLPELAAELVRLGVDVIVTVGGAPTRFAKLATAAVPIVMATSVSPVETGLVTSLARPGGNLTGMTVSFDFDMDAKRLQLFKEAVPRISRVGLIHRAPLSPKFVGQPFSVYFKEVVVAAQSLRVTVIPLLVEGPEELPALSDTIAREHVDALFVDDTPVNARLRREIAALAAKHRVPWMGGLGEFAEVGALLVYGPNTDDLCRRAATPVHRILNGAKPGDLPIEQPTTFNLVVNLKAAKALGLTIPQAILQQATEVVQ
jgi:ABC-type uncharacterized transport system substrate-binding protein